MSQGSIHYPRINADIQALAAQLEPESLEKQWYEKPIGKIGVGLFVAIISAGFVYYLGWY